MRGLEYYAKKFGLYSRRKQKASESFWTEGCIMILALLWKGTVRDVKDDLG